MRNNKKSQSAMEFLMTYGWAILIVIVIIGAFVYFGVLKPRDMVPRRCTIQGFNCGDHKLSATGLDLVLTNAQGYDIRVDSVAFSSETPGIADCAASTLITDNIVAVGESLSVSSEGCDFDASVKAGSRVKGFVNITFTEPVQQTTHKIVGTLITDVEG